MTAAALALLPPDIDQMFSADDLERMAEQVDAVAILAHEAPDRATLPESEIACHRLTSALQKAEAARKVLEAIRDARVRPLNVEVKAVNAVFTGIYAVIDAKRKVVEASVGAWRRKEAADRQAEQERKDREAREAAEREAAARAAAEKAPTVEARVELETVASTEMQTALVAELERPREVPAAFKSAGGGSTSFREVYELQEWEADKIPAEYWRRPKVLESVEKELRAAVRAGAREIPGCVIGTADKVLVRS